MRSSAAHRQLHSFPTRRSSDLRPASTPSSSLPTSANTAPRPAVPRTPPSPIDRKRTRLNSSHLGISYAVVRGPPTATLFPYTTLFRSTAGINPVLLATNEREYRPPARRPKYSALSN